MIYTVNTYIYIYLFIYLFISIIMYRLLSRTESDGKHRLGYIQVV